MSIPITGDNDQGPADCVARFIRASTAGDEIAARAELHPDSQAMAEEGGMDAPPITAVELSEPLPADDGVLIPAVLHNGDSENRFIFAVRPVEAGWGIDLMASMKATFGGDPAEMIGAAMQQAIAPMADAMGAIGSAIGDAMSSAFGSHDSGSNEYGSESERSARRIAANEALPDGTIDLNSVVVEVIRLGSQTVMERNFGAETGAEPGAETGAEGAMWSRDLSLRCGFRLPQGWAAAACTGVTVTTARAISGADLIPEYNDGTLGAETYASWERESGDYKFGFQLAAPPRNGAGLAELSGILHLRVEGGELVEVVLGPLGDIIDREIPIAALNLSVVVSRGEQGQVQISGPYDSFERFTAIDIIDASGENCSYGYSGHGDGETSTRSYDCEVNDDATVRFRFTSQSGTVSVPFAAGGLPLSLE